MANEYADWHELKEMRNIPPATTTQDAALQRAVKRASRAIDRRCSRRFYRDGVAAARVVSTHGRTVTRSGVETLLVDDIADSLTTSITIGGAAVSADTLTFNSLMEAGPVTSIDRASWHGGSVVITAEWGWPAVPASIEEATLLLANRRYMRKDSPEGTSGWSQEGQVGVSRFDSDIEDLVAPFVIYGFGA